MKRSSWIQGKEIKKSPEEIFSRLVGSTWERNPGFDFDSDYCPYEIKITRIEKTDLGIEVFFVGDNYLSSNDGRKEKWNVEEKDVPITFENLLVWYNLQDIDEAKLSEAAFLASKVHNIPDDFLSPITQTIEIDDGVVSKVNEED